MVCVAKRDNPLKPLIIITWYESAIGKSEYARLVKTLIWTAFWPVSASYQWIQAETRTIQAETRRNTRRESRIKFGPISSRFRSGPISIQARFQSVLFFFLRCWEDEQTKRSIASMVQRLGRVGDESAESYPSQPAPRRVRVTSQSTQLRGDWLGRESELTRSTRHYDDNFVPHRNSMWK